MDLNILKLLLMIRDACIWCTKVIGELGRFLAPLGINNIKQQDDRFCGQNICPGFLVEQENWKKTAVGSMSHHNPLISVISFSKNLAIIKLKRVIEIMYVAIPTST